MTPQLISIKQDTMLCFTTSQAKNLAKIIESGQHSAQLNKIAEQQKAAAQRQLAKSFSLLQEQNKELARIQDLQKNNANVTQELSMENMRLQRRNKIKSYLLTALFGASASLILNK
ncbi:MAG: hypothetical protein AAFO95_00455 [Cyanobacteria bacterium J06600_6]